MGNLELPGAATGSKQMLKVPIGTYEFGANLISNQGVRYSIVTGCVIYSHCYRLAELTAVCNQLARERMFHQELSETL